MQFIKRFRLVDCCLTSAISGKVEQQDVGAEVGQVVEGFQMLLKFPIWQFGFQDGCQVTKYISIQRRRPAGKSHGTLYETTLWIHFYTNFFLHFLTVSGQKLTQKNNLCFCCFSNIL